MECQRIIPILQKYVPLCEGPLVSTKFRRNSFCFFKKLITFLPPSSSSSTTAGGRGRRWRRRRRRWSPTKCDKRFQRRSFVRRNDRGVPDPEKVPDTTFFNGSRKFELCHQFCCIDNCLPSFQTPLSLCHLLQLWSLEVGCRCRRCRTQNERVRLRSQPK